jgi:hypothetical protein
MLVSNVFHELLSEQTQRDQITEGSRGRDDYTGNQNLWEILAENIENTDHYPPPPRRYPYFGAPVELMWSYDPESYAGKRDILIFQVGGWAWE